MFGWVNDLLANSGNFMPHGYCYLWQPSILWLHIVSDAVIALAYYSIPFALFYFVKKRTDLAYRWVFVLFAVFICLCGTTHLMNIWIVWYPNYWIQGFLKLATALVSIITAALIWPLIPTLLKLPSPQTLQTNEAYLRAIFDATPDAMLISDEAGNITMANQQAALLFGYTTSELLEQNIDNLVPARHREQHPILRAQFAAMAIARPMGLGRAVKALCKNGDELDVEISLSPIKTKQGFFFASAIRDITERKRAEAILRASEERFRWMANNTPVMIWITDTVGEPTFVNKSWLDFTGLGSLQSMTYEGWINTIHPDDRATAFLGYYQTTETHDIITTEYRLRNTQGEWRWILDKGVPLYDDYGAFKGYIGSAIDITDRKQVRQKLQDKEQMLSESQRIAHIGSWSMEVASAHISWSDETYRIYGVNSDSFAHTSNAFIELVHPDDRVAMQKWLDRCLTGKKVREIDFRIVLADGSTRFIRNYGGLRYDENRKPLRIVGSVQDITEHKQAEINLQIAAVAFQSQEAIVITDANSTILRINKAFTESTGYSPEEAIGQKISLLKSGRHDTIFYKKMWDSISNTGSWVGEVWDRRKNGEIYPKLLSITAVKNHNGIVTHYVGTHADITERKEAEKKIEQLAFYDPLTQLPNRRLLQDRLKKSISSEQREGKELALLMLDLDRFKAVNDSLGHLAGDELLQQVAERITARVRTVDTVARLGGDEFIILLKDINHTEDAARIAEEIVADLSKPFRLTQSDNVQIGASIGISLYPEHGDNPEILMDRADTALYQAKDAGRGCFAYFSEDLTNAALKRLALENQLRLAIEQHQLRVFYQPQVDITSGHIVGAEALVRWQDPIQGIISPELFIPIAEETGMIFTIGEWVLRETCRQGRQWLDDGLPVIRIAVNVSPQQFLRGDLCALVATVLEETGFPANSLELEITESGLMDNQKNATNILNCLRALGIHLAIDDFGTGYSSLAYLKHFPLDVLKIDKSFIDDIPREQDDMEIAATIIAMGHILGFKVLAEGVETAEQLAFLKHKGCDMYQGYLTSRPLPANEFAIFLRQFKH